MCVIYWFFLFFLCQLNFMEIIRLSYSCGESGYPQFCGFKAVVSTSACLHVYLKNYYYLCDMFVIWLFLCYMYVFSIFAMIHVYIYI